MARDYILFYLNGRRFQVGGRDAFGRVADFLRGGPRLVGTKISCAEGACGACAVLKGRSSGGRLSYRAINSCIHFLYQLDCSHVVTVEGVSQDGTLSAVQDALLAAQGAQCGFCTPGMVVALTAAQEQGVAPDDLPEALSDNLCRCTGYLSILEAGRSVDRDAYRPLAELYPDTAMAADFAAHRDVPVEIQAGAGTLYVPATLPGAARLKDAHPEVLVVSGATELGVPPAAEAGAATALLSLGNVRELSEVRHDGDTLVLGAGATWTQVEEAARTVLPELSAYLRRFAAPQLRNVGTVAGSIVQGSPIADSLPPLLVLEAQVDLVDAAGERTVPVKDFTRDDGAGGVTRVLRPGELVRRVRLPLRRAGQALRLFKVSGRRGFDRSIVSAAFLLDAEADRGRAVRIALGGVGPRVMRLPRTERFLAGRPLDEPSLRAAGAVLRAEIAPVTDGRASAEYRGLLAENLLLKFFHSLDRPGTEGGL